MDRCLCFVRSLPSFSFCMIGRHVALPPVLFLRCKAGLKKCLNSAGCWILFRFMAYHLLTEDTKKLNKKSDSPCLVCFAFREIHFLRKRKRENMAAPWDPTLRTTKNTTLPCARLPAVNPVAASSAWCACVPSRFTCVTEL